MKSFGLLIALILLSVSAAPAQESTSESRTAYRVPEHASRGWAFGVYLGVMVSAHSGGFIFPAEQPPMIAYDDGSGLGPALGIRVDIPFTSSLSLSSRLFAECRRGTFTSAPFQQMIIGQHLEPQPMSLEDELDVILRIAGIDLLLQWQPFDANLYLAAGPSLGFKLYEEFTVTERILDPPAVTFLDGSREREMYQGDPDMSRGVHAGIRLGLGYILPIGSDLATGAELSYVVPLQTVTEADDWKLTGLLATVTFLFRF
ncbi:MAG: hypothetical protein JXA28_09005 [Bacteroidetes bacterium]|nr:hypothetical protein [Bacteroidota bacterium]